MALPSFCPTPGSRKVQAKVGDKGRLDLPEEYEFSFDS